jgi:hypothetical protein
VAVVRDMPSLAPILEQEVERLWQAARLEHPDIFNGRVFSADEITPQVIRGHWTEFRRTLAQIDRPELYEDLGVHPLAVNGVIRCGEGVLIGRRNSQAVYCAGLWQLPPAGSVDQSTARPDGTVDLERQLLEELQEELGLSPDLVGGFTPLCLIEHPETHVTDFGIEMHMNVSADAVLATHAASGNQEYEDMLVLPVANVLSLGDDLLPTVPVFLARLQELDARRCPANRQASSAE